MSGYSTNYHGSIVTGPDKEHVDKVLADLERQRARAAARTLRWGTDNLEQMRRLCDAFPTLRGKPGTDPFDAEVLLRWLLDTGGPTAGSSCAARFVLQVWDYGQDWRAFAKQLGIRHWRAFQPFNPVEALARWDAEHAQAFLAYCELPFHP